MYYQSMFLFDIAYRMGILILLKKPSCGNILLKLVV